MANTRTFKGGVHPHETGNGKQSTNAQAVIDAKVPAFVTIPLSQHIGAPCKCVVTPGQVVAMGQVIGEAGGFVSAPVHASVSGKVKALCNCVLQSGKSVPAVVIENDFEDRWDECVKPRANVGSLNAKELLEIVRDRGIVGLGGATFPTAVKLAPPPEKQVDTLILNGAECEPYLTSDHRLMLEHAAEVVDGMLLEAKMLGASRMMVGIEDNKPDAVSAMQQAAQGKNIEVVALPTKYPQGGEKQLIFALTGRRVPNGGLPADVKTVVSNVSTAYAVSKAVRENKPLIDRVVTVAGHVKKPANLRVRIGTPLLDLVQACGGFEDGVRKVVLGGPMMGAAISTLNIPVTKGTSGLLAFGAEGVHAKESPCIRCGRCVQACPMRLVPTQIDAYARRSHWEDCEKIGAMNCMECGACTFVCPAKRELTQSCRMAKLGIRAAGAKKS